MIGVGLLAYECPFEYLLQFNSFIVEYGHGSSLRSTLLKNLVLAVGKLSRT